MEGALMMRFDRANHQNGYREVVIRVRVAGNWPDCEIPEMRIHVAVVVHVNRKRDTRQHNSLHI
jgi:hypothetical protein